MKARVEFVITRDSVAMGDDMWAPHRRTLAQAVPITVARLVRASRSGYLATIAAGRATWVVRLRATKDEPFGTALAVVAQQRQRPWYVIPPNTALGTDSRFLHFHYLQQQDPEEIHAMLIRK